MRRVLRLLLILSLASPLGPALQPSLQAAEPQFERVQLSSEFYSEGGTFGEPQNTIRRYVFHFLPILRCVSSDVEAA